MRFEKIDIARRQLVRALSLFFRERDFVSAITLAGAAEEILGQMLEQDGGKSAYRDHKEVHYYLSGMMRDSEPNGTEVNTVLNGVRNGLKHFGAGEALEFDPEQEAVNVLYRAMENYLALGGEETDLMTKLKWYQVRPTYKMWED